MKVREKIKQLLTSKRLQGTNRNHAEATTLQDGIRGALVGGAIGDALGYPVEFLTYTEILQRYGKLGITQYDRIHYWEGTTTPTEKALISDDTQMTLFTANGLLNSSRLHISPIEAIKCAYLEWLQTQTGTVEGKAECWIRDIPEMNKRRAPGNTCITALQQIKTGIIPHNDSKGCGGVMRVAPLAFWGAVNGRMSIEEADKLAGRVAALTHKHPLGFIPAALDAHIIYMLAQGIKPTQKSIISYIKEGIDTIRQLYPQYSSEVNTLEDLINLAIRLSLTNRGYSDEQNIRIIGEGWTAEENLAIALYCAVRYIDNLEAAIIASVNHDGDSDSTGAVTGNIIGAIVGYKSIPRHFLNQLELHDVILGMADDLYTGSIQIRKNETDRMHNIP